MFEFFIIVVGGVGVLKIVGEVVCSVVVFSCVLEEVDGVVNDV